LCIVAAATAVWTMASLAPAYLKYVGRQRFVVVGTSLAVLAHVAITFGTFSPVPPRADLLNLIKVEIYPKLVSSIC
jgi:hypothetical protein